MYRFILYSISVLLLIILNSCAESDVVTPVDRTCVLELLLTDGRIPTAEEETSNLRWDYRYYIFNSNTGELMRTRDVLDVDYYKEVILLNQVNYKANIYVVANHINIASTEFEALSESELLAMKLYITDNVDPSAGSNNTEVNRPILLGRKMNVLLTPSGDRNVKVTIPISPAYARLELDISFKNGTPTREELDNFYVKVQTPLYSWLWPGKGVLKDKYNTLTGFTRIEGNRIIGEQLLLENEQGIISSNRSLEDMITNAPKNATRLTMGIGVQKYILYVGGEPNVQVPIDFTSYNVRRGYRYKYQITIDINNLRQRMPCAKKLFTIENVNEQF